MLLIEDATIDLIESLRYYLAIIYILKIRYAMFFCSLFITILLQCSNLCASGDSSRFPYLSRLPENSIIRRKCLSCPNDFFPRNGSLQDTCRILEEHVQSYAVSKLEYDATMQVHTSVKKCIETIIRADYPRVAEFFCKKGIPSNEVKEFLTGKDVLTSKNDRNMHSFMQVIKNMTNIDMIHLFNIAKDEYNTKNRCDEEAHQKNLAKGSELEATFGTKDTAESQGDTTQTPAE